MNKKTQETIAGIVKSWVGNSRYSQSTIADLLHISQPVLNLQLNGKRPISTERIKILAENLTPPSEDLRVIRELLSKEASGVLDFYDDDIIDNYEKSQTKTKEVKLQKQEFQYELCEFIARLCSWLSGPPERFGNLKKCIGDDIANIPLPDIALSSDDIKMREIVHSHPFINPMIREKLFRKASRLDVLFEEKVEYEFEHSPTIKTIIEKLPTLDAKEQEDILFRVLEMKRNRKDNARAAPEKHSKAG